MSVPAAYLAVLVIWSTTPLAVAWSSETVHPVMAAWLRMALAAVLGLVLVRVFGLQLPWHRTALKSYGYAVLGVFGAMFCTYLAVAYVPTGLISVMYGLSPLLSGLLGQRLLGEKPFAPHQWIAFILSLGGLAQIFLDDLVLKGDGLPGMLLLVAAVVLFALSGVMVKRVGADVHPLPATVGALLVSLPLFGVAWLLLDGTLPTLDFSSHSPWAILYLATFGSLVGFVCYFYVLRHLPASTVALVTLATPAFALMLGSWLNDERLTVSLVLGSILITLGLALYFWGGRLLRPRRKLA